MPVIYRYTGSEALFAGGEVEFGLDFGAGLSYEFIGEYVYGRDLDARIPLPSSPPAQMHQTLTWEFSGRYFAVSRASFSHASFYLESRGIAPQRQISRNEDPTSGGFL